MHVESRSLEKAGDQHDVCVTCIPKAGSDWFDGFLHQLQKQGATNVRLLRDNTSNKEGIYHTVGMRKCNWKLTCLHGCYVQCHGFLEELQTLIRWFLRYMTSLLTLMLPNCRSVMSVCPSWTNFLTTGSVAN